MSFSTRLLSLQSLLLLLPPPPSSAQSIAAVVAMTRNDTTLDNQMYAEGSSVEFSIVNQEFDTCVISGLSYFAAGFGKVLEVARNTS